MDVCLSAYACARAGCWLLLRPALERLGLCSLLLPPHAAFTYQRPAASQASPEPYAVRAPCESGGVQGDASWGVWGIPCAHQRGYATDLDGHAQGSGSVQMSEGPSFTTGPPSFPSQYFSLGLRVSCDLVISQCIYCSSKCQGADCLYLLFVSRWSVDCFINTGRLHTLHLFHPSKPLLSHRAWLRRGMHGSEVEVITRCEL